MKLTVSLLASLFLTVTPITPAGAAGNSQHRSAAQSKTAKLKAARTKTAKAAATDYTGEQVNFLEWRAVREFVDEMVQQHGFDRATLEEIVKKLRYVDSAVQLVKPAPPGKPKNWQAYSARFIEPVRINAGVRFWDKNAEALARAEAVYGVPAEIIVGIIGVETLYGRDTGRFRVLDALATLAFAYPETPNRAQRMTFFRSELVNTLLLAHERGIDPFLLLGSFAGAVGLPQFMPGNILKYGVDFDGDGQIELRDSDADAIGSVANFLAQHGWNPKHAGPSVFAADVSPGREWEPMLALGLKASLTPEELRAAGVTSRGALPDARLYGLVDLQNGAEPTEYWVADDNFFTIAKYNRSYFYAMSVIELGRAVRLSRKA